MIATRSFNFLYGTIEFRAKFSGGDATGSWPIVLLYGAVCQESDPTGTDNNCDGQEIDIAEFLNSRFTTVNEQIHVFSGGRHNDQCLPTVTDAGQHYHTYDLVWLAGSLVFSIDGTTTCRITQTYVPSAPMYLKVDQFVGGTTGGKINNASLPWTLSIDYIKVIQNGAVVFEDDFNTAVARKAR
jgi:beta-glucanase (GH16 family)